MPCFTPFYPVSWCKKSNQKMFVLFFYHGFGREHVAEDTEYGLCSKCSVTGRVKGSAGTAGTNSNPTSSWLGTTLSQPFHSLETHAVHFAKRQLALGAIARAPANNVTLDFIWVRSQKPQMEVQEAKKYKGEKTGWKPSWSQHVGGIPFKIFGVFGVSWHWSFEILLRIWVEDDEQCQGF